MKAKEDGSGSAVPRKRVRREIEISELQPILGCLSHTTRRQVTRILGRIHNTQHWDSTEAASVESVRAWAKQLSVICRRSSRAATGVAAATDGSESQADVEQIAVRSKFVYAVNPYAGTGSAVGPAPLRRQLSITGRTPRGVYSHWYCRSFKNPRTGRNVKDILGCLLHD